MDEARITAALERLTAEKQSEDEVAAEVAARREADRLRDKAERAAGRVDGQTWALERATLAELRLGPAGLPVREDWSDSYREGFAFGAEEAWAALVARHARLSTR